MTDDVSKIGKQTAEEITETLLVEVVKKVSIDDGDILIVKAKDPQVFEQFYSVLEKMHEGKIFMLVEEDGLDILREISEEEMAKYGWVRASDESA